MQLSNLRQPTPKATTSPATPDSPHVGSLFQTPQSENDIVDQLLELSKKADRSKSQIPTVNYALYMRIQVCVDTEMPELPVFYDDVIDSFMSPAHGSVKHFCPISALMST